MKVAYLIYNRRSSVTGKQLFNYLKINNVGGFSWRRSNRRSPRLKADLTLRWGNSINDDTGGKLINTREAVENASNKLKMMKLFQDSEVTTPRVVFTEDLSDSLEMSDRGYIFDKMMFVRNRYDEAKYRDSFLHTDKYALEQINKVMELRVHIVNGKTVGVYEKMPYSSDSVIYKDANCRFRRVNTGDEDQRNTIIGARPLAKKAVEALGLDFGGVDVIKDSDGKWYVLEVNSAPGLNQPNLKRWADEIINIVNNRE